MDETFSLDLDILYNKDDVPEELYELVRQNLYSQLDTRLHELPNSIDYLTTLTWHSHGQSSLLMVAALNGYNEVVRVLLTHCNSIDQIELKGQITLSDDTVISGATALYCACYQEHFIVAKTLIELGKANVDQGTHDCPRYPLLIHASMMNRINIVRFLIENNYSDVNETRCRGKEKCTALIWAASRGYISLIEYLINCGADVNYVCADRKMTGRTSLLLAIIGGHREAVQMLYEAGADMNTKNYLEHTALMIAVIRHDYSIINFFLERSIYTVEDLELATCTSIDVSSTIEQMHEALELLKLALQQRELMNLPKNCIEPIIAYEYKQECQTIDELESIKDDSNRILIETFLIRERIFLLRKDISIMKPLHYYGDMLVNKEEFDKCLDLWIHMFYLYQQIGMTTILHRFVWLFCKMLTVNRSISVNRFLQICQLIFELSQIQDADFMLYNALYLIIIADYLLKQKEITKEEQISIYHWIKDLCKLQLISTNGQTLLHLCVDFDMKRTITFRYWDIRQHIGFPNERALRLLLTCGNRWLDIDAMENSRKNTALHLICQHKDNRQIIELLLKCGSHMDCVNKHGKTPIDYIKDEEIRVLFMPKPIPLNLKCLCARMIANNQSNTKSLDGLTASLNKFVSLHSKN